MRTEEELTALKEDVRKWFLVEFDYEMSEAEILPFLEELKKEQLRFFVHKRLAHLKGFDICKFIKLFTNGSKTKKGS